MLSELIEALQIFLKYGDTYCPTHCEHDVLWVMVDPADVSAEDTARLTTLGFSADAGDTCFKSYRYGSA